MQKKIYFIVAAGLLSIVACQKDEKANPTNSSGDRVSFIAEWSCQENSKRLGQTTFDVEIKADSASSTGLLIYNIYNLGISYKIQATVNRNSFIMYPQIVSGNQIEGNGNLLSSSLLNMKYTVDDAGVTDTVTATLTKK